ncbi:hypothetical protein HK102_004178 [Quaeritorhiza haematococci]|nr:hypothetical protein HK102_004178 [Quaeritorhiza haematococci]
MPTGAGAPDGNCRGGGRSVLNVQRPSFSYDGPETDDALALRSSIAATPPTEGDVLNPEIPLNDGEALSPPVSGVADTDRRIPELGGVGPGAKRFDKVGGAGGLSKMLDTLATEGRAGGGGGGPRSEPVPDDGGCGAGLEGGGGGGPRFCSEANPEGAVPEDDGDGADGLSVVLGRGGGAGGKFVFEPGFEGREGGFGVLGGETRLEVEGVGRGGAEGGPTDVGFNLGIPPAKRPPKPPAAGPFDCDEVSEPPATLILPLPGGRGMPGEGRPGGPPKPPPIPPPELFGAKIELVQEKAVADKLARRIEKVSSSGSSSFKHCGS